MAIQVAIALVVLLAVVVALIQLESQVTAFWHGAMCLDVRKGC